MSSKIGMIDSGMGGLLVLKACVEAHPECDFVFVGDQLHAPYGEHDAEKIFHYVTVIMEYFASLHIYDIIISCNTICANILPQLRARFSRFRFFEIIDPTVAQLPRGVHRHLAVLSTEATAKTHAYKNAIQHFDPAIAVQEIACPEFVPLIEGNASAARLTQAVKKRLKDVTCDGVVLACTHYPYLREAIAACLHVPIYDSNQAIVNRYPWPVSHKQEKGSVTIYSTLDGEQMEKQIASLLKQDWKVKTLILDF